MKRTHFFLGMGVALAGCAIAEAFWHHEWLLLGFACCANFNFGRWAEASR